MKSAGQLNAEIWYKQKHSERYYNLDLVFSYIQYHRRCVQKGTVIKNGSEYNGEHSEAYSLSNRT